MGLQRRFERANAGVWSTKRPGQTSVSVRRPAPRLFIQSDREHFREHGHQIPAVRARREGSRVLRLTYRTEI